MPKTLPAAVYVQTVTKGMYGMKILLVQCPVYDVEMPPLGLASLAAALKKAGFFVQVMDINVDFFHSRPDYKKFWNPESYDLCLPGNFFLKGDDLEEITEIYLKKILETQADIIGFSVQTTSSAFSINLAARIKQAEPAKIIIFGGPECLREEQPGFFLLEPGRGDYLVLGEAEEALVKLAQQISRKESAQDCNGLVIRRGQELITTGNANIIEDLDYIPNPDFSLFSLDKYLHRNALPVLMSRGCINRCAFCVDTWYQARYRRRSCGRVVEEISDLHKNFLLRRLKFNDLLINGDHKFLEDFCDTLRRAGLKDLYWSANMTIHSALNEDILKKMYACGCRLLAFGVESASNGVLKAMGKGYTKDEILRNLKLTSRAGIYTSTNWIVGFPGETREDLMETIEFIAEHKDVIYAASAANTLEIVRGSILSRNFQQRGITLTREGNWSCVDNTQQERAHRQGAFNEFLAVLGILNRTHNTDRMYEKSKVGHFKTKQAVKNFKDRLYGFREAEKLRC
ncbi:MAG: B12-binding domain-containing radical SAM protein [Candidatus Omnitrophica bacterium]|nr:B12-binding domain-containing radical SAM protein [Candidatus Omnitrophota bacterium]